jgi:ERCC4-related helicase
VRRAFASGRLNLLLSTSIGAEGLDFAHCSLVAALDPPKHVTPFLQSGGRARAPGSEYWLLVSNAQEQRDVSLLLRCAGERRLVSSSRCLACVACARARTRYRVSSCGPFALAARSGGC